MRGRRYVVLGPVLLVALALGACGDADVEPAAQTVVRTVTATETVTATVTATVTEPAPATSPPDATTGTGPTSADGSSTTGELPELELAVLEDGCAVERSEGDLHNLTWSVYDELGVQVLGRNALGETRYRYFQPGTWTVVLRAWAGDRYVPVSEEVTITC